MPTTKKRWPDWPLVIKCWRKDRTLEWFAVGLVAVVVLLTFHGRLPLARGALVLNMVEAAVDELLTNRHHRPSD